MYCPSQRTYISDHFEVTFLHVYLSAIMIFSNLFMPFILLILFIRTSLYSTDTLVMHEIIFHFCCYSIRVLLALYPPGLLLLLGARETRWSIQHYYPTQLRRKTDSFLWDATRVWGERLCKHWLFGFCLPAL